MNHGASVGRPEADLSRFLDEAACGTTIGGTPRYPWQMVPTWWEGTFQQWVDFTIANPPGNGL